MPMSDHRAKLLIVAAFLFSASGALAGDGMPAVKATPESNAVTGVFRSVAVPVSSFPAARNWKAVRPSVEAPDFMNCDGRTDCVSVGDLRRSIESVSASDLSSKLDAINRTVNRLVRYVPDARNYGSMDVWASPGETLSRGDGDCEDYAILKMAALREAGVPMRDMSVVVVRDTRRNLFHAVLSVKSADGYLILDNLSGRVMSDRDLHSYIPLYSVGAAGAWIHGYHRDATGAT
jgi:predicted transglutaminase-like cysteine proteinase